MLVRFQCFEVGSANMNLDLWSLLQGLYGVISRFALETYIPPLIFYIFIKVGMFLFSFFMLFIR